MHSTVKKVMLLTGAVVFLLVCWLYVIPLLRPAARPLAGPGPGAVPLYAAKDSTPSDNKKMDAANSLIHMPVADVVARFGEPVSRVSVPGKPGENWDYTKIDVLEGTATLLIRDGQVHGVRNQGFNLRVD